MAAGKPDLKTAPAKVEHAEGALHSLGEAADSRWGAQLAGCTAQRRGHAIFDCIS